MAKNNILQRILSIVVWLTGVIVSLAVSFAMINKILTLPNWLGGDLVTLIAGYIVLVTTVLGVLLAVIDYFS